jgi:hypothetical protein
MVLFGALLLSPIAQQVVDAAASFTTEEPLKFTFPLPDKAGNTVSFLLFSSEGDIAGATVQLRQIKAPDGQVLPHEAVRASLETDKITPQGGRVVVTLEPRFFATPGEYRIILFFQGSGGSPNLVSTVILDRPAADINLDEVKDQTIELTRFFPGATACGSFVLHLRENTGKTTLGDLRVFGQGIYLKDTKVLVPGEVIATPLADDPVPETNSGRLKRLKVDLSKVRYTGAYDTQLLVTSPGFSGDKPIPVKITVQDFILFPLVAIALGVLGGYWIRRLAAVVRPRKENSFHLLRLQNEVERYRELVKKPASIDSVQSLLAQLSRARESNELGDFASVRADLPKIQEALNEFRKAQVEAAGEVQKTLNSLLAEFAVLKERDDLTDDEIKDLDAIGTRLEDVEDLLRLGRVDDAEIRIEREKQLLPDLKARKLNDYFKLLKNELTKLSLTEEGAKAAAETLKTAIQEGLNSNEFDKVQKKLGELKDFIEVQKTMTPGRGARARELGDALPQLPGEFAPAGPVTHIEVVTPVVERVSGTNINFSIVDDERIIAVGDELRWYFGEVGSFVTPGPNTSHRYQYSGRYQVRVEIVRNGDLVKTLSEIVTISPGEIERTRAGLLQDILRNEKALSYVALVLAIIGGILFLYSGKLFGSLVDYLLAILWGFGLDNTIKGFADVFGKISSTEA